MDPFFSPTRFGVGKAQTGCGATGGPRTLLGPNRGLEEGPGMACGNLAQG